MTNLKNTTALVEHLLRTDKQTRNSDSYLYLKVLERLDEARGTLTCRLPLCVFLQRMNDFDVPGFETVRRSRQKIQAMNPELAACEKVAEMRSDNERKYRSFALAEWGGSVE